MAVEISRVFIPDFIPPGARVAFAETRAIKEVLPPEIRQWYLQYAQSTWNSVNAMIYPETGLPADRLNYHTNNQELREKTSRTDKTNLTNIGFSLVSVGAAAAMGFIPQSEAEQRIDRTITTIEDMTKDPEVFFPTREGKGLFVNWIQPSTGKVLNEWPENGLPVKKHISSVDQAWLIASSLLIKAQFPPFAERIQKYLNKFDLPYMLDPKTGFFHGCLTIDPPQFEMQEYDEVSEARIVHAVSDDETARLMGKLFQGSPERRLFIDPEGHTGLSTYKGGAFEAFWPTNFIPEHELNPQWRQTLEAHYRMQIQAGNNNKGKFWGFSPGLAPDGQYHDDFRVPGTGKNNDPFQFQPVVTVSAVAIMAQIKPVEVAQELKRIHQTFPALSHIGMGDGDSFDPQTGAVQRDQLLANQAMTLTSYWNVVLDGQARKLFMTGVPPAVGRVYQETPLW
jgi:hypothetical protein